MIPTENAEKFIPRKDESSQQSSASTVQTLTLVTENDNKTLNDRDRGDEIQVFPPAFLHPTSVKLQALLKACLSEMPERLNKVVQLLEGDINRQNQMKESLGFVLARSTQIPLDRLLVLMETYGLDINDMIRGAAVGARRDVLTPLIDYARGKGQFIDDGEIAAYAACNDEKLMREYLDKAKDKDRALLLSVVQALQYKRIKRMWRLLHELGNKKENDPLFPKITRLAALLGEKQVIEALFAYNSKFEKDPDKLAFSAAEGGALALMWEFFAKGKNDFASYNSCALAASRGGQLEVANQLFDRMFVLRFIPNFVDCIQLAQENGHDVLSEKLSIRAYQYYHDMCEKLVFEAKTKELLSLLKRMEREGCNPKFACYIAVAQCIHRGDVAEQLLEWQLKYNMPTAQVSPPLPVPSVPPIPPVPPITSQSNAVAGSSSSTNTVGATAIEELKSAVEKLNKRMAQLEQVPPSSVRPTERSNAAPTPLTSTVVASQPRAEKPKPMPGTEVPTVSFVELMNSLNSNNLNSINPLLSIPNLFQVYPNTGQPLSLVTTTTPASTMPAFSNQTFQLPLWQALQQLQSGQGLSSLTTPLTAPSATNASASGPIVVPIPIKSNKRKTPPPST